VTVRGGAAALAFALVLGVAACGGDSEPADPQAQPVGPETVGSVARLAKCRHWNAGTEAEKRATVVDVREQVGIRDTPTPNPVLDDDDAYELFEEACAEPFAEGFLLYKLYARAAAYESFIDGG
jgi:hypothetical protein